LFCRLGHGANVPLSRKRAILLLTPEQKKSARHRQFIASGRERAQTICENLIP
jgi:hypothetical protein